jgi:hypothetical protein
MFIGSGKMLKEASILNAVWIFLQTDWIVKTQLNIFQHFENFKEIRITDYSGIGIQDSCPFFTWSGIRAIQFWHKYILFHVYDIWIRTRLVEVRYSEIC